MHKEKQCFRRVCAGVLCVHVLVWKQARYRGRVPVCVCSGLCVGNARQKHSQMFVLDQCTSI